MGVSCFNGRGSCFTDGSGAPFLSGGGRTMGFGGEVLKKITRWAGGGGGCHPLHYGKP